jgi:hypothetical protein
MQPIKVRRLLNCAASAYRKDTLTYRKPIAMVSTTETIYAIFHEKGFFRVFEYRGFKVGWIYFAKFNYHAWFRCFDGLCFEDIKKRFLYLDRSWKLENGQLILA